MTKKSLSESDIRDLFITPPVHAAESDKTTQLRREYTFTDGRTSASDPVHVHDGGRRLDRRRAQRPL